MAMLAAPALVLTGIPGVGGDSSTLDYVKGLALPLVVQAAMLNPRSTTYITRQLAASGPGPYQRFAAGGGGGRLRGDAIAATKDRTKAMMKSAIMWRESIGPSLA